MLINVGVSQVVYDMIGRVVWELQSLLYVRYKTTVLVCHLLNVLILSSFQVPNLDPNRAMIQWSL